MVTKLDKSLLFDFFSDYDLMFSMGLWLKNLEFHQKNLEEWIVRPICFFGCVLHGVPGY